LGLLSACLVWIASRRLDTIGWSRRIFMFSPLRSFGKYSYGIYVLHYPIVILLQLADNRIAPKYPGAQESGGFLVSKIVLGFGLSYLAALISWNLLERPFLRWKDRFAYTRTDDPQPATHSNLIPDASAKPGLNSALG
jgi:peptidoglycan/LPS O-acetylase OafA/YrhL